MLNLPEEDPTSLYRRLCDHLCERPQTCLKIVNKKQALSITNASPVTPSLCKVIELYQPTTLQIQNSHIPH